MNRDAVRPLVLVAICGLAVIFASATISTTVEPTQGGGAGTGGGSAIGGQTGGNPDLRGNPNTSSGLVNLSRQGEFNYSLCLHVLREWYAIAAIVAGLLAIGAYTQRKADVLAATGLTFTVAIPVGFLYFILTSCGEDPRKLGMPEMLSNASAGGGGAAQGQNTQVPNVPVDVPVALYVLVGIGLLAVIVVAIADRDKLAAAVEPVVERTRSSDPELEDEAEYQVSTGAVGRAAGRAADRIEDGTDVENEVYRAWAEMTQYLEVDRPHSSTPAEFAAAAVSAGMDPGDVDELTELFEEVRYGGEAPTEDREHRAVEALRRIEDEYAEARGDAADPSGGDGADAEGQSGSTDGPGSGSGGTEP